MAEKNYSLPDLPYEADALEPVISKEQLTIHHDKHHKAYVDAANDLFIKMDDSRTDGESIDVGVIAKKLSFNAGGHILHSLFWRNLAAPGIGGEPSGKLKDDLETEFGSIERFRSEFYDCATTIEGSGWAALLYDVISKRLVIMQIGNHNLSFIPNLPVILVLDMWEHAFYLDYKNDKKEYADRFWQLVNWNEAAKRYERVVE